MTYPKDFVPPYPPTPQKETGLIAFVVATVVIFNIAIPFSQWFEKLLIRNGITAGYGILEIAAVIALWIWIMGIVQTILNAFKDIIKVWWVKITIGGAGEGRSHLVDGIVLALCGALLYYIVQTLRGQGV